MLFIPRRLQVLSLSAEAYFSPECLYVDLICFSADNIQLFVILPLFLFLLRLPSALPTGETVGGIFALRLPAISIFSLLPWSGRIARFD